MYGPATEEDLAETVRQVEALDRRIVSAKVDVRNSRALRDSVDAAVGELGGLDIVCANAGVFEIQPALELADEDWREMIDINLTGVWNTCRSALPHMLERGGSIVITSSTAGIKGFANLVHYAAAKHGVVGIMRSITNEFAPNSIRCNTVHPTTVNTVMVQNEKMWRLFDPENPHPTLESATPVFEASQGLPVPWVESLDVSNAVLFLASDEARFITGATLPVDAGCTAK